MQKIERIGARDAIFNIKDILLCYAKYYGRVYMRRNKSRARLSNKRKVIIAPRFGRGGR